MKQASPCIDPTMLRVHFAAVALSSCAQRSRREQAIAGQVHSDGVFGMVAPAMAVGGGFTGRTDCKRDVDATSLEDRSSADTGHRTGRPTGQADNPPVRLSSVSGAVA